MDNEKFTDLPDDSSWLDEILAPADTGDELGADEQALDAHGMGQISDMELEKIIQETMSEDWDLDDLSQAPDAPPVLDTEYRDSYDDEPDPDEEDYYPEETEEEPEDPDAPVRKVRPKRKNGYGLFAIPHLLSTVIWIVLVAAIGMSLGRLLWVCAADVLAFGRDEQIITIDITAEDDIDSITDKLFNAGLIKYKQIFKLYATLSNAEEDIDPGTYELSTQFDYHALVGNMHASVGIREVVEDVTIPEGYTCAQIFALLEEKGVCTVAELEEYAATSEFASYWFLEGTPRGDKYCLEGFLFPDTYDFYEGSTAKEVFIKFLDRFGDQFSNEMKGYLDTLNERLATTMRKNGYSSSYIEENKMTLYDVVIVASMIEKESAHSGESYDISSVIYNRLANPNYLFLNIDATIVYALGGKSDLTEADKELDSPYNTYKYPGLTPGPISNPGLSSLLAALGPSETKYYYYALDPSTNEHHFSKTYQEHLDFLNSLG